MSECITGIIEFDDKNFKLEDDVRCMGKRITMTVFVYQFFFLLNLGSK